MAQMHTVRYCMYYLHLLYCMFWHASVALFYTDISPLYHLTCITRLVFEVIFIKLIEYKLQY